ncbi:hypothetical protein J6590_007864 [Homalodisca vitripennis]|nr:hypothetical protein J6590_007864 [Homalodisca vitripennis]
MRLSHQAVIVCLQYLLWLPFGSECIRTCQKPPHNTCFNSQVHNVQEAKMIFAYTERLVVPSIVPDLHRLPQTTDSNTPLSPMTLLWNCLVLYFGIDLLSYATKDFLFMGIRELRPIEVKPFRPKNRLDIVLHTAPIMSSGVTAKPISAERDRCSPLMLPVVFEKLVLSRACNVRTEQADIVPTLNK